MAFFLYEEVVKPYMDACGLWEEYRECLFLDVEDVEADAFLDDVRVMLDAQDEVA